MTSTETPPGSTAAGLAYPTRTKVIIIVVLALAIGALVLGGLTTADTDGQDATVSGPAAPGSGERIPGGVEARIPRPDSQVLGQERIGIDLAPGWTGELLLQPQSNDAATVLPEDELERDELNRITYKPEEGKAVERLSGDYCLVATIWDQVEGREATERIESWCFSAT